MKIKSIINEISEVPVAITDNQVDQFCNLLNNTRHVFVSGAGRSGLMIKAFANRLLQLGYPVSVIGEVTAPHTHNKDVIIFNTASGRSQNLLIQAKEAVATGVYIIVVTTNPSSELAKLANLVLHIPAQSKVSDGESIQPMGALFEQYSLLFFDSLVLELMKSRDVNEQTMRDNHANIE